jgi:NAD(P)-dependent dehydrogenase (short-subunit alcohol dehydrogenase family)
MNLLNGKTVLVTGGSRGFGRAMVEALAAENAHVWTIARNAELLEKLKTEVKGVQTRTGNITDPGIAPRLLSELCPDILILNAGANPPVRPILEQSWEEFGRVWDTDVRATFEFGKAALSTPLKPGSTIMILSSGAALNGGSQYLGGYPGAKRTQWFMAQYFQDASNKMNLGLRFVTLVPRLSNQTELGHQSVAGFAAFAGISEETYLQRFGVLLTPVRVAQGAVEVLTSQPQGLAFGFSDNGQLQPLG